jgi:hypothetical protein
MIVIVRTAEEDSLGYFWGRVVQLDPITGATVRCLNRHFLTEAEARAWTQKITREWRDT